MKGNRLLYINIGLAIGVVIIIGSYLKERPAEMPVKPVLRPAAVVKEEPKEPAFYDIGQIKDEKAPKAAEANLAEVYSKYGTDIAGRNMVKAWSKVKPADKTRFYEEVDKKIEEYKTAVSKDPKDRIAKKSLFVAEMLKKLADKNFDYDLSQPAIKEQMQILKKKSK